MSSAYREQTGGLRISADVGGTFTDVAVFSERTGQVSLGKVLTTPGRLVAGMQSGLDAAGGSFAQAELFLHGTTIAINTILERSGARAALITTRGFRDIYEIGRINRPESYNLFFEKHVPLIPRSRCFEVVERVDVEGRVLVPLDETQLMAIAAAAVAGGVSAIAIVFLHSYRNPAHEQRARQLIEAAHPGIFVTASHELSQEYREFERTSTTAANAYVGPRVKTYLGELMDHAGGAQFKGTALLVQSNGGLFDVEQARTSCIRMLESGPAAGVIAACALCGSLGLDRAIAFDMGGTTAKAGVIHNGQAMMTHGTLVGGYAKGLPIQIPMIDIQEVGTGGGSIARVDEAGSLFVGPESAGAEPGPACYGLGGEQPTITDANIVLGRLCADRFLGGRMPLDAARAAAALLKHVALPLGLDVASAAEGILSMAAIAMSHVVRGVTTERGLDVAEFPLIAYGGAGPLHAVMIARELGMAKVIVPVAPGHFSAIGMLDADLRRDFVVTWFQPLGAASFGEMEALYARMEKEGGERIAAAGVRTLDTRRTRAADMRYVGQEHAVTVELPLALFESRDRDGIKRLFDREHEQRYGYAAASESAEIVSLRSAVTGVLAKPAVQRLDRAGPEASAARAHSGPVRWAGVTLPTPAYRREALRAGHVITGPALVEEHASTTVLYPGDTMTVDEYGNLVIAVKRS